MSLPLNLDTLFTQEYDGFRAVKLRTATETVALENALSLKHMSYQTKITRSKKRGREFVVMLVGGAPNGT